jgi:3'-5' exonuclease
MVFDLETIPDLHLGRRLLGLSDEEAADQAVIEQLLARRGKPDVTNTFLPHYLQKIVAISVVVATPEWVKVWSLGDGGSEESDLIKRFFEGIERYTPNLVSWNGSGFDFPVLHYRSLMHSIAAPRYWEIGDTDQNFKWNNYLGRYHRRHTDLMDLLANYQNRAYAPMDDIAVMLGLPGKMGMHGSEVFETFQAGGLEKIRNYCETDVLNTYLIFLRFQLIQGLLDQEDFALEQKRLGEYLLSTEKDYLLAFHQAWKQS